MSEYTPEDLKLEVEVDKIYLEMDEFQDKIGSIIMPEKHQEQNRIATIIQAGPLSPYMEAQGFKQYNPGDRVLVSFFVGTVLHIVKYNIGLRDQDKYRICTRDEILARVIE